MSVIVSICNSRVSAMRELTVIANNYFAFLYKGFKIVQIQLQGIPIVVFLAIIET